MQLLLETQGMVDSPARACPADFCFPYYRRPGLNTVHIYIILIDNVVTEQPLTHKSSSEFPGLFASNRWHGNVFHHWTYFRQ